MRALLAEVLKGRKGHWGLVEPLYYHSKQVELLEALRGVEGVDVRTCDCEEFCLRSEEGIEASMNDSVEHLRKEIGAAMDGARQSRGRRVCYLLTRFHCIPVTVQRDILNMTRGLRESSTDVHLQTIVCGSWNRYSLHKAWQGQSTNSPCPDQKSIRSIDSIDLGVISEFLQDEGWISEKRGEIEDLIVEAFAEFTGGDQFVMTEVLAAIKMADLRLRDFYEVLDEVSQSDAMIQEIRNRVANLSREAVRLLRRVLEVHVLSVNIRDTHVEDLRLFGVLFLKRSPAGVFATIASPVLDATLRNGQTVIDSSLVGVYCGDDVMRPSKAINSHAYGLVLEIETLLRNWIVSALSENTEGGWRDEVGGVKVPGCNAEVIAEEIKMLGDELFTALHPDLDLARILRDELAGNDGEHEQWRQPGKKTMVAVIESAKEWKQRWQARPSVRLSESGLPSFLTTGALMNIYMAKGKIAELVGSTFGTREQAKVFFSKFSALRTAVAHNQSLELSCVEDLIGLRTDLCRLLSSRSRS